MPYPWECIDCTWLDPNDKRWGDCYCKKNRYYVDPASASCRHFDKKSSSATSPCYLTTAMCNILGHEDDCEILNTLRGFRDNYMKNTPECLPLLEDYDTVGPIISERLHSDENRVLSANIMLYFFIGPAINCINNEDYDTAIEIYKDMTISLMEKYGLDQSMLASSKVIGENMQRKRELQTV